MKSMRVLFWVLISALSIFISAAILYSCSSGGGGETGNSGTVAVYATGDSSLNSLVTSTSTGTSDTSLNTDLTSTTEDNGNDGTSLATRMTATIMRIELVNKGTGTSCIVLDEDLSLSIADLSNIMHLITEAD